MNNERIYIFTSLLFDFLVTQKMNLQESLEIISKNLGKKNHKFISETANQLNESLKNGNLLSTSLKKSNFIKFDSIYISFIRFAEITGNLPTIITFLKERCQRKKETKNTIISASIYPLFVIFLAIFASLFLVFFSDEFILEGGNILKSEQKFEVMKSLFIFLLLVFFIFYLLYKNLSDNKIYEAFLAIGFLLKNGINMSVAIGYGVFIVGSESKEGKKLNLVKERLEIGMDLKSAFGIGKEKGFKIKNFENAIYYAERGGGKSDVFEKIAELLKEELEQKRKIGLTFVEPLFVGLAGLFLIVLVMNFFMPLLTNLGENF